MPNFPAARCNLGTCYKFKGNIDEAINQNRLAIQSYPLMIDPYMNLGNLFKELGRLEECLPYYKKATELEPNNHIHYSNLGVNLELNNRMPLKI